MFVLWKRDAGKLHFRQAVSTPLECRALTIGVHLCFPDRPRDGDHEDEMDLGWCPDFQGSRPCFATGGWSFGPYTVVAGLIQVMRLVTAQTRRIDWCSCSFPRYCIAVAPLAAAEGKVRRHELSQSRRHFQVAFRPTCMASILAIIFTVSEWRVG